MARKPPPFSVEVNLHPEDVSQLFAPFHPMDEDYYRDPHPELAARDEPFDPIDWAYLKSLGTTCLNDLIDVYYRAVLIGAEKLPDTGPLIVAPNHSGNAFPHDAMVLDALLWRHHAFSRAAKFRSVYSPKLAAVWWMRPFGLDNWWRRGGGVDMTFTNFDLLLKAGKKVIYYPEGVPGIGKGFTRRYQLQHYHSSFIVLAARHHAPIYPVSVVNAEWVNPTSLTFRPLDRLFDRLFGLPFFPVPTVFAALLFPFIFYLAFPCRMVFLVGDPIDARVLLKAAGEDPDHPTREGTVRVAEQVRRHSQRQLDEAVAQYGQKPYDLKGFFKALRAVRGRILRTTPLGWPFTFIQHDRNLRRPPARNRLHAFLRDLDILAFYVPFGWFLIALFRKFRTPPCGYRGLSKQERMEQEGSYRWSLATRPLQRDGDEAAGPARPPGRAG